MSTEVRKDVSFEEWIKSTDICVSGSIGAGKTTACRALRESFGCEVQNEPSDENPYLVRFYENKKAAAFAAQIFFIAARFSSYVSALSSRTTSLFDRSVFEDKVFADMLYKSGDMDPVDYATYRKFYDAAVSVVKKPSVFVYLDATPEKCLERVQNRYRKLGQECKGIDIQYLSNLRDSYDEFLENMSKTSLVCKVNWNVDHASIERVMRGVHQLCMNRACTPGLITV
jgi:deoxyadenosine/deoxycytidine kinase